MISLRTEVALVRAETHKAARKLLAEDDGDEWLDANLAELTTIGTALHSRPKILMWERS